MILIGSRAAWERGVRYRKPNDYDFIATEAEAMRMIGNNPFEREGNKITAKLGETHFEFDLAGGSNTLLKELVRDDSTPNLDLLFTIKKAHRYKKDSPHFWKTLADYHCMKALGAKVRPEYEEFFALRQQESYAAQKHPKLNTTKDAFFTDIYTYDHDSIHDAVALQEQPAYRYFLKGPVWTSRELFDQQPRQIQINSVIEESCVLAIERSLVPHPGVKTPLEAWRFAVSKVCSSIASGWWREFAYENALTVLKQYPADYWDRFQKAVTEGKVKLYESSSY
jgi:hypothetical protein